MLCILYLCLRSHVELQSRRGMETLLEQQRRYHEERERLMDGMVQVGLSNSVVIECYLIFKLRHVLIWQERLYTKANHRDSINSEHRQRAMLERSTLSLRFQIQDFKEEFVACFTPFFSGTTNAPTVWEKSMKTKMAAGKRRYVQIYVCLKFIFNLPRFIYSQMSA